MPKDKEKKDKKDKKDKKRGEKKDKTEQKDKKEKRKTKEDDGTAPSVAAPSASPPLPSSSDSFMGKDGLRIQA